MPILESRLPEKGKKINVKLASPRVEATSPDMRQNRTTMLIYTCTRSCKESAILIIYIWLEREREELSDWQFARSPRRGAKPSSMHAGRESESCSRVGPCARGHSRKRLLLYNTPSAYHTRRSPSSSLPASESLVCLMFVHLRTIAETPSRHVLLHVRYICL